MEEKKNPFGFSRGVLITIGVLSALIVVLVISLLAAKSGKDSRTDKKTTPEPTKNVIELSPVVISN